WPSADSPAVTYRTEERFCGKIDLLGRNETFPRYEPWKGWNSSRSAYCKVRRTLLRYSPGACIQPAGPDKRENGRKASPNAQCYRRHIPEPVSENRPKGQAIFILDIALPCTGMVYELLEEHRMVARRQSRVAMPSMLRPARGGWFCCG